MSLKQKLDNKGPYIRCISCQYQCLLSLLVFHPKSYPGSSHSYHICRFSGFARPWAYPTLGVQPIGLEFWAISWQLQEVHGGDHEKTAESRRNWQRFQREHGGSGSRPLKIIFFILFPDPDIYDTIDILQYIYIYFFLFLSLFIYLFVYLFNLFFMSSYNL